MSEARGLGVLIRNAQSGDASARAALMDRFAPCVEQFCRDASVRSDGDLSSTDVVQEAWLRIWQKFHQFRGPDDEQHVEATLFNWLRQTARSVIVNLCESRAAQRRNPPAPLVRVDSPSNGSSSSGPSANHHTLVANDDTPSEIAIAEEEARRIEAAINALSDPIDRDIIRSRFFAEVSLAQLAERIGIDYDEARQRFHRAMVELEKQLSELN